MKSLPGITIAGVVLLGSAGLAREADSRTNSRVVVVAADSELHDTVVNRVAGALEKAYRIPTRIDRVTSPGLTTAATATETNLVEAIGRREDAEFTLALLKEDGNILHGKILRPMRMGVLSASRILPDTIDSAADMERYLRRVEKEAVLMLGRYFGLPECPMPLCALSIAKSEKQFDAKGRNLCPPCERKAQEVVGTLGLLRPYADPAFLRGVTNGVAPASKP